jgi:hypothetical protein
MRPASGLDNNEGRDMSDTPQGPDWYQASDGRWYPPQPASTPPPPPGAPAYPTSTAPAGASTSLTLSPGALVVAISGLVGFIFSFLALFSESSGSSFSSDFSVSSWNDGFRPFMLLALLLLIAAILYGLKMFGVKLPEKVLTFSMAQLVLVIGVYGTLLSFGELISNHTGADVGVGLIFMLLTSIGVIVGGVLELAASGEPLF